MNLKSIRKEKGYTLKEVSEGTGLPERSLAYWEKGERQPAADVLPKLAGFFKISVDELLDVKTPTVPAVEEETEIVFEENSYGGDRLLVSFDRVEKALYNEYDKVKKSFFKLGYFLTLINKYSIYKKQGYANIVDYAENKLGIGSSTTYSFMQVYELTHKFRRPTEMEEKFLPYKQSQLVEFARAKYAGVENVVKPSDTSNDTRAYVSLWNRSYGSRGVQPEGATVKEALEIAAEKKEKKNAIPAPTVVLSESNACPGQTSMFDEEDEGKQEDYSFVPQGESYSSGSVSTAYVDMSESEEDFNDEGEPEPTEETFVKNGELETSLKELFRKQVQEFLSEYNYRIELYGRAQGAYGFAGSLFEYLKGKGFFDEI